MLLFFLFWTLLQPACCKTNELNGIVPLKSTRADVERILGAPVDGWSKVKSIAKFRTSDASVIVIYSTGPCDITPSNGWSVPEGVVVRIDIAPDSPRNLESFDLDLKKFPFAPDGEILNEGYYTNEKDGISLTFDTWEKVVTRISYVPQAKLYYLTCENQRTGGRKVN